MTVGIIPERERAARRPLARQPACAALSADPGGAGDRPAVPRERAAALDRRRAHAAGDLLELLTGQLAEGLGAQLELVECVVGRVHGSSAAHGGLDAAVE